MTDEDVVRLAGDLLEARVFPSPARQPGHKDVYTCRIRGGTAADLMRVLAPQLGIRRNSQINCALAGWQATRYRRWLATEISDMTALRSSGCSMAAIAARYGVHPKRVTDLLSAARRNRSGRNAAEVAASALAAERWLARAADGGSEMAWVAGLMEGEGYFGSNRGHLRLSLQMTDRDVVERAADLLGARLCRRQEAAREHWTPTWQSTVYGRRALDIAERLEPFMGYRRRDQIQKMRERHRPPKRFVAPPERVVRNLEIARRHRAGESGPVLAAEFGMTHQNVYYIARRYRG